MSGHTELALCTGYQWTDRTEPVYFSAGGAPWGSYIGSITPIHRARGFQLLRSAHGWLDRSQTAKRWQDIHASLNGAASNAHSAWADLALGREEGWADHAEALSRHARALATQVRRVEVDEPLPSRLDRVWRVLGRGDRWPWPTLDERRA